MTKKEKKHREPLKPRVGPYKKINAYTIRPSLEQILTLSLSLLIAILHSIFIVKPITTISHPILYVMLAFNYLLVLCLIVTYVQVTVFDPVDRFILNPEWALIEQMHSSNAHCNLCRSDVHIKSYHCKRCNRCTEDFDHHCVFLNACIGSLNYQLFLRILILYVLFLLLNIGQAIWVFVVARRDTFVHESAITEWMAIVIIIICSLTLIPTTALLVFHSYISCCLDLTTIAFYQSETNSQHSSSEQGGGVDSNNRLKIDNNQNMNEMQTAYTPENGI